MRVRWRQEALHDLARIRDWLSTFSESDPDRAIERIRIAAESLARRDIGRPSIVPGLEELSVRTAPYVVFYAIEEDTIDIRAVFHMSEKR
jgi:plasmid stabilization system protein ParE